jgi:ankyrin repeat protein
MWILRLFFLSFCIFISLQAFSADDKSFSFLDDEDLDRKLMKACDEVERLAEDLYDFSWEFKKKATFQTDYQDEDGNTYLHILVREESNLANLVLERGANPNIQNQQGHTPLHLAAMCIDFKMVKILLAFKADANIQDYTGNTPLHYLVDLNLDNFTEGERENIDRLIDMFLKFHGRMDIANYDGNTAMELALSRRLSTYRIYENRRRSLRVYDDFENFYERNFNQAGILFSSF